MKGTGRAMRVLVLLMVALCSCAAEGYENCDSGEDRALCEDEGADTYYCDDYYAPHNADECWLIADLGPESIWCCP
jgi:hypothetical protein